MSRVAFSVAMTGDVDSAARSYLLRPDGQEDVCFALWRPSTGRSRTTAILQRLVPPVKGDRRVHGNASFNPAFFERALAEAAAEGCGLALLHSHPQGRGWQGMSPDDVVAEQSNAGAVLGATRFPFIGLTLAGDKTWSARFWRRSAPRTYERLWCGTVRVVADALRVSFNGALAPVPLRTDEQIRTASAWGDAAQADLSRVRVGVVGAGSVGGIIAEGLARIGIEDITLIDFDRIERVNLDRLQYATRAEVGELKVTALAHHLARGATASQFRPDPVVAAVFEEDGYRAALDCDVLFSCVDRPWGRHVLNLIAYAHLIPVVDGGIAVRTNRIGKIAAADWSARTATVGRQCLLCANQYDAGLVQTERDGLLDDPTYISGLPKDHPLKTRENVFAFSLSCASLQLLQMLALVIAPVGQPDPGEQRYHFVGGFMETPIHADCDLSCHFRQLIALGDHAGIAVTGSRPPQPSRPHGRPIPRGGIFDG